MSESIQQEQQEACPSPLGWQEVVFQFDQLATPWALQQRDCHWTGRIWGSGPPLYFLNGIVGDCSLFALLIWLLREEFKCVLIDYPQQPEASQTDAERTTLASMAEDIIAITEYHEDTNFAIYATSWGTVLGQHLLAAYPDKIQAALFQGAILSRKWSLAERLLLKLGRHSSRNLSHLPGFQSVQRVNHLSWFPPFDETRMQFYLDNIGCTSVQTLVKRIQLFTQNCEPESLARFESPLMLVDTEGQGKLVRADQEILSSLLPNVYRERLDNSGSLPHLTHPHRISKLVKTFLLETD